jgi:hypothetical protein
MRLRSTLFCLALATSALTSFAGCTSTTSFVHTDTTLGRVVVYRNGVAYYERYAHVDDGELKLAVPADKVDDFLKSLTVVDAHSGKPAPVSYPTSGTAADSEGLVRMTIQVPKGAPHDLKLSYVTESPAWKPSYRITLGDKGKVDFQGWAIVDNTSGEDWKNVKLGVGSSSALSFRFDLRSVRLVQRETLRSDLPFAMAPPAGGSTYYASNDGEGQRVTRVLGELHDDQIARAGLDAAEVGHSGKRVARVIDESVDIPVGGAKGGGALGSGFRGRPGDHKMADDPPAKMPDPIATLTQEVLANDGRVIIEGFADKNDEDKNQASLERANRVRDGLIKNGVSPDKVVAIGSGEKQGQPAGIRVLQAPDAGGAAGGGPSGGEDATKSAENADAADAASLAPIDTSHFESSSAMTVARGTSAMVSIYDGQTDGEVVYLYDPETPRGNATFPFKSVRIKNPTDSALESGPVTVFGNGRFIGEGLSDAIPPKSTAFVPFALDRQIVVEKKEADRDEIARIITVERGVFSTEAKHIKKTTFTLTNRLGEEATVYVRHTPGEGFKITKSPGEAERLGAAYLFKVEIEPGAKTDVEIEEETPVYRSTDIRSADGMDLIKAYVSNAALDGPIKQEVADLVKLQESIGNIEQRIATLHEQMDEFRARMDELHAQIVTLKVVKTAGPLMDDLQKKLGEVSDKVSKETIDVVGLEEQLMVAKIQFQEKVAELSFDPKAKDGAAALAAKP